MRRKKMSQQTGRDEGQRHEEGPKTGTADLGLALLGSRRARPPSDGTLCAVATFDVVNAFVFRRLGPSRAG